MNKLRYIYLLVLFGFYFLGTTVVYSQKESLRLAKLKGKGKERYTLGKVSINDKFSNFGTSFYGSDKVVFTSPAKRSYIIRNIWETNGQPYLDLYQADIASDGNLVNVKRFPKQINSRYHEGNWCFSKNKQKVYFTRSNYVKGRYITDSKGVNRIQLFEAKIDKKGKWYDVKKLPFNSDEYSIGHPSLSPDERTLYFVSDMPGGIGKTDIYKVSIDEYGGFKNIKNLGPRINTKGREMFPFIDGKDLYYSSDGREGYGRLDIYMTRLEEGKQYPIINLGDKINSNADDFSFVINPVTRMGYFSSNRYGGKGDDDIYSFKEEYPYEFKFDCSQKYAIKLKDKKTGEPLPDSYISIYRGEEELAIAKKTDISGVYNYAFDCGKTYRLLGKKKYYIESSKEFTVGDVDGIKKEVVLELSPAGFKLDRGKVKVDVKPIYFDYNKFNIRPDAAIELDRVVAIMQKYPKIKIEAGSHTDSKGKASYNQKLSYRRAKSTVDYITSKGISPLRIVSKGYGESKILNGCVDGVKCSNLEHQLNRRTEFVITNPEVLEVKN